MYIIKEGSTCCLKEDKKFSNSCQRRGYMYYILFYNTVSPQCAEYTLGIHICMYLI